MQACGPRAMERLWIGEPVDWEPWIGKENRYLQELRKRLQYGYQTVRDGNLKGENSHGKNGR